MKHCATCRFFGKPAGIELPTEDLTDGITPEGDDVEEGETPTTRHHLCNKVYHFYKCQAGEAQQDVDTIPALVTDGEDYEAMLRVLPTFGCQLHEDAVPVAELTAPGLSFDVAEFWFTPAGSKRAVPLDNAARLYEAVRELPSADVRRHLARLETNSTLETIEFYEELLEGLRLIMKKEGA